MSPLHSHPARPRGAIRSGPPPDRTSSPDPTSGPSRPIGIGKLLRAHGVRGDLTALAYGDTLASLQAGESVWLSKPSEPESRKRAVVASARDIHAHRVLLHLEAVDTRDEAGRLTGYEVQVSRARLAELADDEYYCEDLLGLDVVTPEGRPLGKLSGFLDLGPHDVFVVHDGTSEILLPAIEDVIQHVDLAGRRIVATPFDDDTSARKANLGPGEIERPSAPPPTRSGRGKRG